MKNMKKALCILTLALLSLALLAGCGSSGDKLSDPAAIEAYGILRFFSYKNHLAIHNFHRSVTDVVHLLYP